MTKKHKYRSNCPINYTQEILGDKWSMLIIRDLMFAGKRYYGEFLKSDEKISTNILADRLGKLEQNGLITKTIDEHNFSKNLYSLTPKAIDLMPILIEMIGWGLKYNDKTMVPPAFLQRLQTDKTELMKELKRAVSEAHVQQI